jgi:DNA repair exonuclease SbcCD nuclease subunit
MATSKTTKNKIIKKPTKKNKKIEAQEYKIIQLEKNLGVNIRYIIHLADIHIRKKEREEEYREVFDNLYNDLKRKKINKENSLIVVCGDILHDKSDLHPVSVKLTKDFFIMLCKITSTIVIPGNHDVSLLNQDHNSLESILKNLETENALYLLNNEGYYEYNNILFGHTRFGFSKSVLKCNLDFDGLKIGLYHGIVTGGKGNDFEFFNSDVNPVDGDKKYFSVNDFSDYDFTFLGDIHKHSFLKKNIAYPGSLIQQTIDESLDKGYIFWDLEKSKGTFYKVYNDYGKVKIEIDEDGQSCYDVKKLPKKLDIRIDSKSLDRKYIEDIYKKINNSNIIINKKIDLMIGSSIKDTKILIDGKEQNLNVIKNTNDLSNFEEILFSYFFNLHNSNFKTCLNRNFSFGILLSIPFDKASIISINFS